MANKSAGGEIGFEAKFTARVKKPDGEWVEQELEFIGEDFSKLENDEPTRHHLFANLPGFKEFYEAYAEKKRELETKGD